MNLKQKFQIAVLGAGLGTTGFGLGLGIQCAHDAYESAPSAKECMTNVLSGAPCTIEGRIALHGNQRSELLGTAGVAATILGVSIMGSAGRKLKRTLA